MAKYMILYYSPESATDRMAASTQEDMQASMNEWTAWKEGAEKSVGFEWGMPLQSRNTVTSAEIKAGGSAVSGYSIIESDSKDTVINLIKTHPHLKGEGTSIEVLEMLPMPGM